jgi:ABC-type lipoprotein export system ATPase subunit
VLVVTHDHRALDLFDVSYEMEDGRIISDSRTAKALASPM